MLQQSKVGKFGKKWQTSEGYNLVTRAKNLASSVALKELTVGLSNLKV
jgi:hypothetical protein